MITICLRFGLKPMVASTGSGKIMQIVVLAFSGDRQEDVTVYGPFLDLAEAYAWLRGIGNPVGTIVREIKPAR